eukprot:CAMPEP_0170730390 /NCGR_PEP_ID=MMETSP0437-20130122/511_1 /TAXON_ID=0 /ORGANISM="Sexangularia sp." /LENGTH=530 /DNA_ID=CAMNT_0011068593 /DNA_START=318 /DNA_END=1907 /DNA_ORIENTATION=-
MSPLLIIPIVNDEEVPSALRSPPTTVILDLRPPSAPPLPTSEKFVFIRILACAEVEWIRDGGCGWWEERRWEDGRHVAAGLRDVGMLYLAATALASPQTAHLHSHTTRNLQWQVPLDEPLDSPHRSITTRHLDPDRIVLPCTNVFPVRTSHASLPLAAATTRCDFRTVTIGKNVPLREVAALSTSLIGRATRQRGCNVTAAGEDECARLVASPSRFLVTLALLAPQLFCIVVEDGSCAQLGQGPVTQDPAAHEAVDAAVAAAAARGGSPSPLAPFANLTSVAQGRPAAQRVMWLTSSLCEGDTTALSSALHLVGVNTNSPFDRDGLKHMPIPPLPTASSPLDVAIYVFGEPTALVASLARRRFLCAQQAKLVGFCVPPGDRTSTTWRTPTADCQAELEEPSLPLGAGASGWRGLSLRQRLRLDRQLDSWLRADTPYPRILVHSDALSLVPQLLARLGLAGLTPTHPSLAVATASLAIAGSSRHHLSQDHLFDLDELAHEFAAERQLVDSLPPIVTVFPGPTRRTVPPLSQ